MTHTMFRKLRNKLVALNLVIISILMLVAFSAIYFMTYSDVHKQINMDLFRIASFGNNHGPDRVAFPDTPQDNSNTNPPNNAITDPNADDFLSLDFGKERSVSLLMITDETYTILNANSSLTLDDTFLETAKTLALKNGNAQGIFKLDGNYWAYLITPVTAGYEIAYLEVSAQQTVLINLIYTFLIVALIMLVFIYLISLFLTNKSIIPIKEAFDKQKQFIADASHELKTPLAVINTNADVLLANGDQTIASQSRWLEYIKSEANRMARLTNDLLYLTQVDHSDSKQIFTTFDLSDTVESTLLAFEAVVFEKGIDLDFTIEDGITYNGNKEQITQVILILLDNALKYTPEKGTIELTLSMHKEHPQLVIKNTGVGISPEHIEHIFDRFYRTDASRNRESGGYGLGLSIAKAIITGHGGQIRVESKVDAYTSFIVSLT